MRIGIEATRINSQGRGIDRYTCSLIKAFSQIDKEDEFVLFSDNTLLVKDFGLRPNFSIEPLAKRFRFIRRPGLGCIGKHFYKDLDLFHFPNSDIWSSKYCKTVVTMHDLAPYHFPERFFKDVDHFKQYLKELRCIKKNADCILTVSDFSKRDIVDVLGVNPGKVFRVYNGLGQAFRKLPLNEEEARSLLNQFNLSGRFILYAGGLDFRKNLTTLIKAFGILSADSHYSDLKLVIVGRRPQKYDNKMYLPLEQLAGSLLLKDSVVFLNNINDPQLVSLYNLASLFVFPSIFEGFGFPPLEAMACGCPVLCSNRCSLPEVVGDAAVLFDPDDVNALAYQIGEIMDSSQLKIELSRKGIERAKLFSWNKTAGEIVNIYKKVAA
ncbi:MAG: glycosyltransferase family 4 protein [Candidatus Omnitrophica bacterium]|nr:glycosyltransferase family 4 protein [Candidatus Omnitrophota bacterium]